MNDPIVMARRLGDIDARRAPEFPNAAWRGLVVGGLDLHFATARPLPATGYAGSALRGLLGYALARHVCHLPAPACAGCSRQGGCAYARLFKPATLPGAEATLPGYLPHRWRARPGSRELFLRLHLFGRGLDHVGTLAHAFAANASTLDLAGGGPGRLLDMRDAATGRPLIANCRLSPLPWPALPDGPRLRVQITTALASKHTGADPLWPALRTRLQRLVKLHGDGSLLGAQPAAPPWRVRDLQLHAVRIPRGEHNPRPLRGWRGTLEIDSLTPLGRELLGAGLLLHAGADTTLGLGRYRVTTAAALGTVADGG